MVVLARRVRTATEGGNSPRAMATNVGASHSSSHEIRSGELPTSRSSLCTAEAAEAPATAPATAALPPDAPTSTTVRLMPSGASSASAELVNRAACCTWMLSSRSGWSNLPPALLVAGTG